MTGVKVKREGKTNRAQSSHLYLGNDDRLQKLEPVTCSALEETTSDEVKREEKAENKSQSSSLSVGADHALQKLPPVHGRTGGPTRRSSKGGWTPEEDETLRRAVQCFKGKNWKKIAEFFTGRTDVQCLHRWQKVLNPELVKGPWTKVEDERIVELVSKYGCKKWSAIAKHLPGRIGKQCRERWHNHLNPAINKDAWSLEEELSLIRAHQIYGNKWAELAKFLPGRTDNAIKNHWNSSIKKKLDSYLASGLVKQFPGLTVPKPTIGSASSTGGSFNEVQGGADLEEISECSQESTSSRCHLSGSFAGPPSSSVQVGLERSELRKETCKMNSDDELEVHHEPLWSLNSKTDGFLLLQDGPAGYSNFPIPEAVPPVSSCELNELTESVITGNSCSVGSPKEVSNAVNVSMSGASGGLESFGFEHGGSTSAAKDMVSSSAFYTCLLLDSTDMVGMSHNLCAPVFVDSLRPISPGSSDMMLNSLVRVGDGICSTEMPSSVMNSGICDGAGCVQEASEFQHSDEMLQYCKPVIHDLKIDCQDGRSGPDMLNLTFDEKAVNLKVEASSVQAESPISECLFYEPPRLPSLDFPFINCDLINSCSHLQQAYSPLGVRQMIMSSVNCSTPYSIWGSYDKSPESFLKSAAKSFRNTPSILRKRRRESSTPVQGGHHDKEASAVDHDSFLSHGSLDEKENSLKDTSSADFQISFPEDGVSLPSSKKPIIVSPPYCLKAKSTVPGKSKEKQLLYAFEGTNYTEVKNGCSVDIGVVGNHQSDIGRSGKDEIHKASIQSSFENVQTGGILVEQNMNSPLFYTSGNNSYQICSMSYSPLTPKTLFGRRSETPEKRTDHKGTMKSTTVIVQSPYIDSPNLCEKKQESKSIFLVSSCQTPAMSASKAIDRTIGEDWLNNVPDLDNLSINCCPFSVDRSLGSPFEWKSPWSLDLTSPLEKHGRDLLLEDMSFLTNSADGRDDAVGLMKHLSEHAASAYAQAEEILSNDENNLSQTVSSVQA